MTVTTWTLTGDVSDLAGDDWPTTGATRAEAYLTAYDADGPARFYVDTATGGKVRFGPTIPITLASDGTFTRAGIPDSSETGLSYALTLTYRPTGHGRSVATTTDRFTLDADKVLNQVGFVNPDFSPAVILANAVDAVVAPLITNESSQTNIALEAEIAEAVDFRLRPYAILGDLSIDSAKAPNAAAALTIPTYVPADDAIVHPDVLYVPEGWNGHRYWMAATPYTSADSQYENPSIWCSDDGQTWAAPAGLTNPVEAGTGVANSYYSDPDLVLGPDGVMYLFFRWNYNPREVIYVRTSTDGVTWTPKVNIIENVQSVSRPYSPAVVWDGMTWHMWAVDGAGTRKIIHMTAADPLGPWSAAADCTIATPTHPKSTGSTLPWHLDVLLVGGQFLALVCFNLDAGSGGKGQLYLATSTDGVAWTRAAAPVLDHRDGAWDQSIYRSSGVLTQRGNGLGLAIWYSAISAAGAFAIGYTEADFRGTAAEAKVLDYSAATMALPPYIAADLFNRADSASSLGTATSGAAWTVSAGTWGISSNAAYSALSSNGRATMTGVADVTVSVDMKVVPAAGEQAWLVVRYSDASNYIRCGRRGSTAYYEIEKIESGASSFLIGSGNVAPVNGETWTVETKGTAVRFLVNGQVAASTTSSFNQSATGVGLQTANTTPRFDNFIVKTTP